MAKKKPTVAEMRKKAMQLFEQENYDEAITLLSDEVLEEYKDAELFGWQARAHYRKDDKITFEKYVHKAIASDPANWMSWYCKALVEHDKQNLDLAIEYYSESINLKPDYQSSYYNRGNAWYEIGEYEKAIADYKEALKINPLLGNAHYNLGLALEKVGRLKDAVLKFEESIKLNYRLVHAESRIKEIQEKIAANLTIELKNGIAKLKRIVNAIRLLSQAGPEITQVVHYSKLFVADKILNDHSSRLHYNNVIYMNDPEEGKTFIEYLKDDVITSWYKKASYKNESTIFLGSFLPVRVDGEDGSAEDQLLMWRTYGKDEHGHDAGGCNFVIDTKFFESEDKSPSRKVLPETFEVLREAIEKNSPILNETSKSLLKVQYIREGKIRNDKNNLLAKLIDYLKLEIKNLIEKNKNETSNEAGRIYTDQQIFDCIQELCHLFKSAEYAFEHEVRVIRKVPRSSESIEYYKDEQGNALHTPKRFFVKSERRILPFMDKLYLGPKVENPSHWSLHFDYAMRQSANIEKEHKARLTTLEANAKVSDPSALKSSQLEILRKFFEGDEPSTTIQPNKLEIIPSTCKFV